MLVVIVTGPPGAGKSTVATALHDALGDAGIGNALIEVDELERAYPAPPLTRTMALLRTVAAAYRDAGHDLLIVTATLEDDAYRAAVLRATEAPDALVVRLEASVATLRRRIVAREPAGWSGLDDLVAASGQLASEMADLTGVDLVRSTEGRPAEGVAVELEAAVRARLAG